MEPAHDNPHHCCVWRLQQDAAQAGGGYREDLLEAGQGRLQEGTQDHVLPATLRLEQEGPAGDDSQVNQGPTNS